MQALFAMLLDGAVLYYAITVGLPFALVALGLAICIW